MSGEVEHSCLGQVAGDARFQARVQVGHQRLGEDVLVELDLVSLRLRCAGSISRPLPGYQP